LAFIVLAGGIARGGREAMGRGLGEHGLALDALSDEKDPDAMLGKIAEAAGNLVTEYWHQIAPAVAA